MAEKGLIDPLENIKNNNVFIHSGTRDKVVLPEVSKKAVEFYEFFKANVKFDNA